MTTPADATSGVDRTTLVRLTAAKSIANTALRWIPPFLPTLEKAFGATTTQLTTVIGVGELAGLSTIGVGRHLDRGNERAVMVGSMGLVALSSVVALAGSLATFAVAFILLILGVANFTVAGHAWISNQVDYRWRARSIGLFEVSWALALLIGAPVIAILINLFGWRGPFVALAVGAGLAAVVVAATLPRPEPADHTGGQALPTLRQGLRVVTPRAWATLVGSATMAMAGLSIFVISGSWLDDGFGVSTGGIGAVAVGFGAVELLSSLGSATFADRIGKMRSTLAGLLVLLVGLGVMLSAGDTLAIGIAGLLVLLLGFEYGFVTSLSLVSEAMPDARGTTLALANGIGTVARAFGAIVGGWLYGRYGIEGTAALSASAAVTSLSCFALSRR